MRERLCKTLGVTHPVVQAPMGGASCPALTAAVSNAGGLGMLALSWSSPEQIRRQISETRALTGRPFGVNLVLAWDQSERLRACLDAGVGIVSFFWGDPAPYMATVRSVGGVVVQTVSTAASAAAAEALGVDIVVAQGWEAGGHVLGEVATLPLTRAVVQAVTLPVLAAGGISDGAGLAAALALGAGGVWVGTRFLCTPEAAIHERYQALLLAADETGTVHSTLFDGGWPDAPHRVLRNETVSDWENAGRPAAGSRPGEGRIIARGERGVVRLYDSATPGKGLQGEIDAMSLWAGQGVGQLRSTEPAGAVVTRMVEDADAILRGLATGRPTGG